MAKGKKLRSLDGMLESDFIYIPTGRRDVRKTLRAVRKRQLRAAELRMRRAHTLRKKAGIKGG